ncbi:hypothetical protein MAR_033898 [Mya arenaria]|uniref:Uncharacterized protein n=1 Tax=Mya arenaria TaxID=6604 RepID=A0ABY7GDZ5_MYAAR|nr:hypothetical protein MAR_033898 [Mya arenaria]
MADFTHDSIWLLSNDMINKGIVCFNSQYTDITDLSFGQRKKRISENNGFVHSDDGVFVFKGRMARSLEKRFCKRTAVEAIPTLSNIDKGPARPVVRKRNVRRDIFLDLRTGEIAQEMTSQMRRENEKRYEDSMASEPLTKKHKTVYIRTLCSANLFNEHGSTSRTITIVKDMHKRFPVYKNACTDVYEITKTTDNLLFRMGLSTTVKGNGMKRSDFAKAVRLIFTFDNNTPDLTELFGGIQKEITADFQVPDRINESEHSSIYIGSRESIQINEFMRHSNAGVLLYGLQQGNLEDCDELIVDVTNTKDTKEFFETVDDILERIAVRALKPKADALLLLQTQLFENTENEQSYELLESELRKLGFGISRKIFKENGWDSRTSNNSAVYNLRSKEKHFLQPLEIDEEICRLKALYARSGVPDNEKPTFPECNKTWSIDTVKSALKGFSHLQGLGKGFGKLNVFMNNVSSEQKEETIQLVGRKLQKVGLVATDYRVHFICDVTQFCHSAGSCIYKTPSSGTLGAFAFRSQNGQERKLCALLSLHVAQKQVNQADESGTISLTTKHGRIGYLLRPLIFPDHSRTQLDIASAQIDDAQIRLCNTQFKDEHGYVRLCTLFDFEKDDLQFLDGMLVHFWGASTSPGLGKIKEHSFHQENGLHIILENRVELSEPFCKSGDSGSVVCAFCRKKRLLIALGMVIGEFKEGNDSTGNRYLALQLQAGLNQLSTLQEATYRLCTGHMDDV